MNRAALVTRPERPAAVSTSDCYRNPHNCQFVGTCRKRLPGAVPRLPPRVAGAGNASKSLRSWAPSR
jgi:hypothetical protein